LAGNTSDRAALREFLKKIEAHYGPSERIWVMDRGSPTEETLQQMRQASRPIRYWVGTPRGRLSQLERAFLARPWQPVRAALEVTLLTQAGERSVLANSAGRAQKARAIRRRRLKKLWQRLPHLQQHPRSRAPLVLTRGAANKAPGRLWELIELRLPDSGQAVTPQTFSFTLRKDHVRTTRRRKGHYLLRSTLAAEDPATLWRAILNRLRLRNGCCRN
jgi:hypothetical protein